MRGNIYFVNLPLQITDLKHSVEQGHRPVVIVSSNVGNRTSNVVMVVPITTKCKRLSCNVDIGWTQSGQQCQALCNQIITMPKQEMVQYKGHVTDDELRRIDIAMLISLGIKVNYNEVNNYDSKREYVKRSV